jgi:hypothetical protein
MHLTLLRLALWVGWGWYELFLRNGSTYARTRAIVLHDRILNQRFDTDVR